MTASHIVVSIMSNSFFVIEFCAPEIIRNNLWYILYVTFNLHNLLFKCVWVCACACVRTPIYLSHWINFKMCFITGIMTHILVIVVSCLFTGFSWIFFIFLFHLNWGGSYCACLLILVCHFEYLLLTLILKLKLSENLF